MAVSAAIPSSPSSKDTANGDRRWLPYEQDPELAAAHLAEEMMQLMGTPGIVSKEFVIWYGLLKGLNHRPPTYDAAGKMTNPGNPTYCDTSLYLSVFEGVFHNSVNINGSLFERFWQYMMKPKMIVQGLPGQNTFGEPEKTSWWERNAPSWLGGGGKTNANNNNNGGSN